MKKFLADNWFKIIIVICILIAISSWVVLNRYYFMTDADGFTIYKKCNKITGNCVLKKAEKWY